MKRKYYMVLMLLLASFIGRAQLSKDAAISFFKTVSSKYANAHYLDFKMHYRYSDLANPSVAIDSLNGEMKINEQNCHMVLGNTETITNHNYSIVLFKDDTLMYLSKPLSADAAFNPLAALDSFFTNTKGVSISLTKQKQLAVFTIDFPEGMKYKTIAFSVDTASGYLQKVVYVIKATELLSPAVKGMAENGPMKNEWGIVESEFYDYQAGGFNDTEFDDTKYFTKTGADYTATVMYKQYKIVKASPNL